MEKVFSGHWPTFFPVEARKVVEKSAIDFAQRYRRTPVHVPRLERAIQTAYVHSNGRSRKAPPVCMLPGFDSSVFDFRNLVPLVEAEYETWAVDVIGWGFTDCSAYMDNPSLPLSPEVKKEHLYAFWKTHIGQPMCLLGVSLGGALAVDFAVEYPEAVECLVLSSAQGYIDGLGTMSKMPPALTTVGLKLLQSKALRRMATKMTFTKRDVDIEQAMIVGRLHTLLPGWLEARLAFIRSDGYAISQRIADVEVPTLILWGRDDKVLDPSNAERFHADIRDSRLKWIECCGHGGHLENPEEIAQETVAFIREITE